MIASVLSPYQISHQQTSFSTEASWIDQAYSNGLKHFSSTVITETFPAKFSRLTHSWKEATKFTSSYHQLLANPSYLELIAMGQKVLPYIFREMKAQPDHWFLALHILTAVNPVKKENMGNVQAMTNDWLNWGREKGYAV